MISSILRFLCLLLVTLTSINGQGLDLGQPTNSSSSSTSSPASSASSSSYNDPIKLRECNSDFAIGVNRIFGGQDAKPMEFPHMASLQVRYFDSHNCGATLITNQWVLCAAHCLARNPYPFSWQIKAGEHSLKRKDSTERLLKISKIIIHEKYDRNIQLYDIALIKLKEPINFKKESHLKTICLAKETDVPKSDYECVATGWGRGDKGRIITDVLQKLPQPIHNYTTCQKIWKTQDWPITEKHICIGDLKGGKGVCNGDSGGPIQCRLKNGEWVQFGVASWTVSNCVAKGYAAVYTKVSSYRDWILRTMEKYSK